MSNPYLSQIERGLRKPSAEVLQQLARALRVCAEQLYVRAGIVHPDPGQPGSVELAILADTALTERQKHSLLDVYASFLALNERDAVAGTTRRASRAPTSPSSPTDELRRTDHQNNVSTTPHPKESHMATTKRDLKTEALKPVLAGVGVTDLAVEAVREAVADVQKRVAAVQKDVTTRVTDVQKTATDPKALRKQAQARRAAIEARVAELQTEARAYPAKVPRRSPRSSTATSPRPTPPTPTSSSAASPSWAASAARSRPRPP